MTVALFVGIRVHDVAAARRWYERLLGEPSFFPARDRGGLDAR
jgi:catechol 2,3-dioxygenase-like lactoylglutathione lyase family enzyme